MKEYWIVDPAQRTIEQHVLRDTKLVLDHTYQVDDTIACLELPGVSFPVVAVFDKDRTIEVIRELAIQQ